MCQRLGGVLSCLEVGELNGRLDVGFDYTGTERRRRSASVGGRASVSGRANVPTSQREPAREREREREKERVRESQQRDRYIVRVSTYL